MVYIMYNFIFIILNIIYLSSHTSASWLRKPYEEPVTPPPDLVLSCEGWILKYEFIKSTEVNRSWAINRARQFDNQVSIWAVMYAHVLVAFPLGDAVNYLPQYYCESIDGSSDLMPLRTLETTKRTCQEWINFYKYDTPDERGINLYHARNRDKYQDEIISLWAAIYGQFLTPFPWRSESVQIATFCYGLGIDPNKDMEFMSLFEWITLSQYGDYIDVNIQRALEHHNNPFYESMNTSTQGYINHLSLTHAFNEKMYPETEDYQYPEQYCWSIGLCNAKIKYNHKFNI